MDPANPMTVHTSIGRVWSVSEGVADAKSRASRAALLANHGHYDVDGPSRPPSSGRVSGILAHVLGQDRVHRGRDNAQVREGEGSWIDHVVFLH